MGPEMLRQFQAISAAKPETETGPSVLSEFLAEASKALVRSASTIQYEAATLPARQMKQTVPAEKFTHRQQQLSRLDGGLEIDGTKRIKLEPTPEEPLGHIAAEHWPIALCGAHTAKYLSPAAKTPCCRRIDNLISPSKPFPCSMNTVVT